jgi:hypothetical protein
MNDIQPDGFLGMKLVPGVAGFVGGCVSLSFIQGLSKWQAVVTVLTGGATGTYLAPVIVYHTALPVDLAGGVGFLLGLTAMGLCGWAVKAAGDPVKLWETFRGVFRK